MYEHDDFKKLIEEARDAVLLKAYLLRKLTGFAGITHSELTDLCTMFGIEVKDDDE